MVEFQFADFISCAFDQIINVVARHHYRTGSAMPIVFRCPFGALIAGLFAQYLPAPTRLVYCVYLAAVGLIAAALRFVTPASRCRPSA